MVTFNYNTDIPAGPNNPSADQPLMQTNTNSINSIINIDHYSFGQSNKDGTHRQVTLTNSGAPGLGAGTGVLYAALVNGNSWPAWQNAAGAIPLTSIAPVSAGNGYVSLPGSLLLQWGSIAGAPFITNNQAVTFPIAFTAIYNINITGVTASTDDKTINVKNGSQTTSGFQVICSGTSQFTFINWIAIGTK